MRELDLTKSELFKSLIEVSLANIHIDLHNDYDCFKVLYDIIDSKLLLLFKGIKNDSTKPVIVLKFGNVLINKISLNFQSITGNLTLDNFYRGRFEKNDLLKEYSEEGRSYFYIEFYKEGSLEIQSSEVKLVIDNVEQ